MLIKALHDTEYGPEGKMHWELFNKDISVSLGEGADLAYAEKCAEALNNLPGETVKAIWEAAKRYCLFFMELCGDEWDDFSEMTIKVTEDTPAEEIKSQIYPGILIVDDPEGDGIGFHMECNCSWEVEHGLEITILDNKLLYLGAYEGCGAWDKFDPKDGWNFVNEDDRSEL